MKKMKRNYSKKVPTRRDLAAEGLMSFTAAFELLRKHNVPGFGSREAARQRIVVDNLMTIQRIGRQYYVPSSEVHRLVGAQPVVLSDTEDQVLLKFYQEDPANDYIKATSLRLSKTLAHAKFIYDSYQEALTDPRVRQAQAEKKREEERKKLEEERAAAPTRKCTGCGRTDTESRAESASVVFAATGVNKPFFDMAVGFALQEFAAHRCPECLGWQKNAPALAMRAKIEQLEEAAATPRNISSNSSGSPEGAGGRTSDGSVSANSGAGAEEAPPLPTTRD